MKIAVVQFPGSNCDFDTVYVLRYILKVETDHIWHRFFKAAGYDAVVLPGGFSYGDALRAGAIAAHSPAMKEIRAAADKGIPILGICNGFQILIEAGLLPGALLPNESLKFVCKWVNLKVLSIKTAFTHRLQENGIIHMPVAHGEGRFFIEEAFLRKLGSNGQIVFQYVDGRGATVKAANPNGSVMNIAGICNINGNILGLMPHPERSSDPALSPFHDGHGLLLLRSMVEFCRGKA